MTVSNDPAVNGRANGPSTARAFGMLARATWETLLVAGVCAIILGILVLAWPGATLVVAGAVFGIYLLLSGTFQLAGAFASHIPGHLRVLGLVSGSLSVLLGLLCFRGAAQSILLLALWIGFGWLLRGIMTTSMALSGPEMPARGWQVLLGGLTIIAGIVLIVSPFASIVTLTVVAGIWLIALGLAEIVHAVQLRGHLRRVA